MRNMYGLDEYLKALGHLDAAEVALDKIETRLRVRDNDLWKCLDKARILISEKIANLS